MTLNFFTTQLEVRKGQKSNSLVAQVAPKLFSPSAHEKALRNSCYARLSAVGAARFELATF